MKSKRNSQLFEKAKITQHGLDTLATLEKINLYYFDESGFNTQPPVPYAWQPKGETRELPSFPSRRFNVLGFLSKQQPAYFHSTECRVNTQTVIDAFDAFVTRYADTYQQHQTPCVVVLDNASVHTSRAFLDKQLQWAAKGVILHYLPPYSPELNSIEILWRKIKYDWLPLACYLSIESLKHAVLEALDNFGTKYQITFC